MPKFKPGIQKVPGSGRKKGTKNKPNIIKVSEYLSERNINPVEMILAKIDYLDDEAQVRTWMDLLSYCQARPKAEAEDSSSASDQDLLDKMENVSDETLLKLIPKEVS